MKPRNEMHTMWNAGSVPARMIEVIQPAGFENFFHGLVGMVDAGMPHPEEMGPLADK